MNFKRMNFSHVMLVALILGGVYLFFDARNSISTVVEPVKQDSTAQEETTSPLVKEQLIQPVVAVDETGPVIFEVLASNDIFYPQEFIVPVGADVKVIFMNENGVHNFVINEYGVKTPALNSGEQIEFNFNAQSVGEYTYYCSQDVCGNKDIFGKLLIK